MPSFKAPQYTKVVNPKTGTQDPCYTFNIDFNDSDCISFIAGNQSEVSLQSLQKCVLDNLDWWNTFVAQFLQASTKFFSKPYTVETINKITKHTLNGTTITSYPINVVLVPKNIQICAGSFTVNWGYTVEPMIDFPDVDDDKINTIEIHSLPVSSEDKIMEGIQELNMNDLPVGDNNTDALELDSPAKFYEKQRVKEARLKAKLAVYKAQRTMAQYYEKYGDDISDSDSDLETSDGDEEDSGNEEVQL